MAHCAPGNNAGEAARYARAHWYQLPTRVSCRGESARARAAARSPNYNVDSDGGCATWIGERLGGIGLLNLRIVRKGFLGDRWDMSEGVVPLVEN